jgi:hypothetical protein
MFDAISKAKMEIRLATRLLCSISGEQPSFILGPLRN